MSFGFRFSLCLFFIFAIISSSSAARAIISGSKMEVAMEGGRFRMAVSTDDYNEPSANHGHDPPGPPTKPKVGSSGGSGSGRRG